MDAVKLIAIIREQPSKAELEQAVDEYRNSIVAAIAYDVEMVANETAGSYAQACWDISRSLREFL